MNLSSQGIEILVLTYTANEQTEYLQRNLQRLPPTSERSLARALRDYFPEKPVNPALIRITACNQTGCECMVCTSNPSLMKGLSCPELGRPFAGQVERLSYKHLFLHPLREARFEHHYPQDSFHNPQDNFSAHIR